MASVHSQHQWESVGGGGESGDLGMAWCLYEAAQCTIPPPHAAFTQGFIRGSWVTVRATPQSSYSQELPGSRRKPWARGILGRLMRWGGGGGEPRGHATGQGKGTCLINPSRRRRDANGLKPRDGLRRCRGRAWKDVSLLCFVLFCP